MRPDIHPAMRRHQRVAFQFSGGRDSTAALYQMRPYWDRITVYHLDTGDQFPETRAVVDRVARDIPIKIVRTDAPAWRDAHGLPTDLLPADNQPVGQLLSGNAIRLASRFDCCRANLQAPLHERMLADGMTLLVRGVRIEEFPGGLPLASGWRGNGLELLHPIEHWSAQDVDDFIARHRLPVAPFYAAGLKEAPECMGCTAWWGDGRAAYLRSHHPQQWRAVRMGLEVVREQALRQLATLDDKE